MNLLYLFLGILCGILLFPIGEKLAEKTKNDNLKGFALGLPLLVFVILVILIDNIF